MSKQISNQELAKIVTQVLNGDEIDDASKYSGFMTEFAQVVCNHFGGTINIAASPSIDTVDEKDVYYVGINGDENLPEDGGIWKDYDPEGEL